jgi:hypothetical protein
LDELFTAEERNLLIDDGTQIDAELASAGKLG